MSKFINLDSDIIQTLMFVWNRSLMSCDIRQIWHTSSLRQLNTIDHDFVAQFLIKNNKEISSVSEYITVLYSQHSGVTRHHSSDSQLTDADHQITTSQLTDADHHKFDLD